MEHILYLEYGSRPYLNHVDNYYFAVMSVIASVGIGCGGIAFGFAAWIRYRAAIYLGGLLMIAGLLAPHILDYYHRSFILVTYLEFSQQCGP